MVENVLAVYGDFNCPFCYALSELLTDSGLSERFQWRSIEHMPGVTNDVFDPREQSLLTTEVYNVRHRAPNLTIAIPPCRPNTAKANRLLYLISQYDPEKAVRLQQQIYRALWVDGRDISNTDVLISLLPLVGFDGTIDLAGLEAENSLLDAWQKNWESDIYEGRIPIIVDQDRMLLGLESLPEIERFIGGEAVISGERDLSCYLKPQQNISILGELKSLWGMVQTLRHQYHIHVMQPLTALQELNDVDHLPDLVLIDLDFDYALGMKLSARLKESEETRSIPVVLVSDNIRTDDEVVAYRMGVSDYMKRDREPEVFKARIDMLLQLKVTRDELDKAARLDGLTQIYNRREFDRVIAQEWRRCTRSRTELSLLMIDIDYFKKYNDCYGHLAGDGCIRLLAQTMKRCTDRVGDLVSRYGGEEFAIVLPDTRIDGAMRVANKVLEDISALKIPHEDSGVANYVTVSIGCFTVAPAQGGDILTLIAGADERLYRAKDNGRNCIVGED